MTLGEWEDRWKQDKISFHENSVHKMLLQNVDRLVSGRSGLKVFFPLCGKSVDMKWLWEMGHCVVGVEISEIACRQFFEESHMTFTEEDVGTIPGAKVFRNSDKTISIYQCDIYSFSSALEGQMGAIWDRGAFVAINPKDREKYAALILSLMGPDCRYLLDTLLYNPQLYSGPPFFVPDEEVHSLFGGCCDIQVLQEEDVISDRFRGWGLDWITEKLQLIVLKQT